MSTLQFAREVGLFNWVTRKTIRQIHKRVIRRDHAMQLPTGEMLNLPISNRFATEAFITRGDVDWGSEKLLYSILPSGQTFLDIGAHIGYYSLYFLPKMSKVFSFEPDPRIRPFLQKNVAGKSAIEVIPCAVGSRSGKALFTQEPHAEASHLSRRDDNPVKQIEVDVVTLDSFVESRSLQVGAIKIDAEGFDIDIIAGALSVLRTQQPIVLTEALPIADLFQLTNEVNYRVFAYVRDSATRRKSFVELLAEKPIEGETKMLFLTPAYLAESLLINASDC